MKSLQDKGGFDVLLKAARYVNEVGNASVDDAGPASSDEADPMSIDQSGPMGYDEGGPTADDQVGSAARPKSKRAQKVKSQYASKPSTSGLARADSAGWREEGSKGKSCLVLCSEEEGHAVGHKVQIYAGAQRRTTGIRLHMLLCLHNRTLLGSTNSHEAHAGISQHLYASSLYAGGQPHKRYLEAPGVPPMQGPMMGGMPYQTLGYMAAPTAPPPLWAPGFMPSLLMHFAQLGSMTGNAAGDSQGAGVAG